MFNVFASVLVAHANSALQKFTADGLKEIRYHARAVLISLEEQVEHVQAKSSASDLNSRESGERINRLEKATKILQSAIGISGEPDRELIEAAKKASPEIPRP
jgi:hypothetical protein